MKKRLFSILACCLVVCCKAQTAGYKYYSQLDSVKASGFYNIQLTPELNAHIKTDYSDIRIVNEADKWVPHILRFPASERSDLSLNMELKFTKTEDEEKNTILVIEGRQNIISNINLVLKNTAAKRFCTLSGSDDIKNWFVINDSILINPVPDENKTTSSFRIDFPPINYKFLKVVILNNNKYPFEVKEIEWSTSASVVTGPSNKIFENSLPVIEQKDSGKISYIKVSQAQPYHFDNINIKLGGIKYFYRNVDLYIPSTDHHSFSNPGSLLESFTISNNSTLRYRIPAINTPVFYLLIHNEDNLPLAIDEIRTSSSYRHLTAYLEKDKRYKLIMGNPSAIAPKYDLTQLNTAIPDTVSFLNHGEIIPFKETTSTTVAAKNNKWILWSSIIAALFILLFFTKKMMKEVDKRKQHDNL